MTLCKRLGYIEKLTDFCPVIADIGSDHGKLACSVLKNNKAHSVVITDISRRSLNKAQQIINRKGLVSRAIFYCTDGFNGIREEIHTAIIAGMGGMEIIKILDNMPRCVCKLILQPMKNADKIREYLANRGFFIETDKKIFSGARYYDIIKADTKKRAEKLSENDIIFGKSNIEDKDLVFYNFLSAQKHKLEKIFIVSKDIEISKKLKRIKNLLKDLYNA